jgi:nucleotide-binding universal stress UspA family protein
MVPRIVVVGVDDSDASEEAVKWTLANIYKDGDDLHMIHVIPRFQLIGGVPPADFVAHHDPKVYEELIKKSEAFIARRVLTHVDQMTTASTSLPPVIHIIKFETDSDSIGTVLCRKAEELNAAVLVVARHDKSKLSQFFLGSVSQFCVEHCKRPVVVHH